MSRSLLRRGKRTLRPWFVHLDYGLLGQSVPVLRQGTEVLGSGIFPAQSLENHVRNNGG